MNEMQTVDRRKGERRKDVESARSYIGMERRHHERRRGKAKRVWDGKALHASALSSL